MSGSLLLLAGFAVPLLAASAFPLLRRYSLWLLALAPLECAMVRPFASSAFSALDFLLTGALLLALNVLVLTLLLAAMRCEPAARSYPPHRRRRPEAADAGR